MPTRAGGLVLGEMKLLDQPVIGVSLLDRVEVLALDVFHERPLEHLVVADGPDHDRDLRKPGPTGGPQAALSGDELEAGVGFADDQRLEDSLLADRGGELLQLILGELTAGLEPIRADQADVAEEKAGFSFESRPGVRYEGTEPPAEGEFLALGGRFRRWRVIVHNLT